MADRYTNPDLIKKEPVKRQWFPRETKRIEFREADRVRFYLLIQIIMHVIFLICELTLYSNVDFMMAKEVAMIYLAFVCFQELDELITKSYSIVLVFSSFYGLFSIQYTGPFFIIYTG